MEEKMLSRVGKYMDEKNGVLKRKDELLSGKRRKYIVKSQILLPQKDPEEALLENVRLLHNKKVQEMQTKMKPLLVPNEQKRYSPEKNEKSVSFRTISRGTYYRINSVRDPAPPCGYYNINYQLVDKNMPTKVISPKRSKSKKKHLKQCPPLRDIKIVDKLKGSYDFQKQLPRSFLGAKSNSIATPHEKRFDTINFFPAISSKCSRSPSNDFSKTRSRDWHVFNVNMTPPMYQPNHEYLKKSLSKTGISFNKTLSRPPIISKKLERELNCRSMPQL